MILIYLGFLLPQIYCTPHNINPLFTRLRMMIITKQGKDRILDLGNFEKPTKMVSNSNNQVK